MIKFIESDYTNMTIQSWNRMQKRMAKLITLLGHPCVAMSFGQGLAAATCQNVHYAEFVVRHGFVGNRLCYAVSGNGSFGKYLYILSVTLPVLIDALSSNLIDALRSLFMSVFSRTLRCLLWKRRHIMPGRSAVLQGWWWQHQVEKVSAVSRWKWSGGNS